MFHGSALRMTSASTSAMGIYGSASRAAICIICGDLGAMVALVRLPRRLIRARDRGVISTDGNRLQRRKDHRYLPQHVEWASRDGQ